MRAKVGVCGVNSENQSSLTKATTLHCTFTAPTPFSSQLSKDIIHIHLRKEFEENWEWVRVRRGMQSNQTKVL